MTMLLKKTFVQRKQGTEAEQGQALDEQEPRVGVAVDARGQEA
jgi:hypothetical protein